MECLIHPGKIFESPLSSLKSLLVSSFETFRLCIGVEVYINQFNLAAFFRPLALLTEGITTGDSSAIADFLDNGVP
jgi:hypothetical protein